MAIDPQILDWYNATITVENVQGTSSGGYGGRKFSAAVNVMARIEQVILKAQSHEGKEVVTKGRLFVAPFDTSGTSSSVSVRPPDRITLPASGYVLGAGATPRIINVEQVNDEYGGVAMFEVLV